MHKYGLSASTHAQACAGLHTRMHARAHAHTRQRASASAGAETVDSAAMNMLLRSSPTARYVAAERPANIRHNVLNPSLTHATPAREVSSAEPCVAAGA
eukprot:2281941-Pleurochrysis_carterae.AAC.2